MPRVHLSRDNAFAAVLFAAGFAYLFRRWLFTGFDGVFGDGGDGEILLALVEHWHRVFAGLARIADPILFYPESGVLGFTDAYLLYGIVHAAGRATGLDTFSAFMVVMALLAAIGFFGFVHLMHRHFAVPVRWAAIGAALFAFANMNAVKLVQAQAYCAMLLPLLCALALTAWTAPTRARRVALAGTAGLLHGLIFLTAYLTGWFFTVFLFVIAVLHPLVFGPARTVAVVREAATTKRDVVASYGLALLIGIIPFLMLYLPVLDAGHRRDFAEIVANAPDARDILNVTPDNWLWGGVLRQLGIVGRPNRPRWEVELGFTPALLAVMAAGLASLLMRNVREATDRARFVLTFGLAVVLSVLVQFDYAGFRPWAVVHAVLPGASAVRYTFRSQIVANLFACVLVSYVLAALAGRVRTTAGRYLLVALAGLLLIEQINTQWPATISRRERLAWLTAIPAAPAECRAFYLAPGASPVGKPGYEHQADAMLFAEIRGIPTILIFKGGQVVESVIGAAQKDDLKKVIDKHI